MKTEKKEMRWSILLQSIMCLVVMLSSQVEGKIHHLTLSNDERAHIILSSFSYLMQGSMEVEISNFSIPHLEPTDKIGFTLSKGDEVPEFLRTRADCFLDQEHRRGGPFNNALSNVVFFIFDFQKQQLKITRGGDLNELEVCQTIPEGSHDGMFTRCQASDVKSFQGNPKTLVTRRKRQEPNQNKLEQGSVLHPLDSKSTQSQSGHAPSPVNTEKKTTTQTPLVTGKSKNPPGIPTKPRTAENMEELGKVFDTPAVAKSTTQKTVETKAKGLDLINNLPLDMSVPGNIATRFAIQFWNREEEGSYYFIYHNCRNYRTNSKIDVGFTISIIEKNEGSFLPAGEVLKPSLYFGLAAVFFATGIVWVHIIKSRKEGEIYKVHYLMTALIYLKSLSLLFHGVDYHYISLYGRQQEAWAIAYYIMHLLKGALLFGTIILIGTGYTFFKNFLTERDRKLFLIVIPLQVLDNVAMIIIDETEEGQSNYKTWLQLFIFIDLLCCAAIILPVIWSIRHLQEASQTDGKAAFNLGKLRLFRHFYIMVICYIYLTRILKYLVSFTVPFKYSWMVVVVEEVGTWLFFVVTGYKFKPAPNNPYLHLSQSDDELEMDEA